ncbi:MAG: PD40 domain-containing protein [Acidobacteriota bacterium]|nr:MAG: PD40 domain-containing protein [Acidobacteriota bacterium]
MPVVGGTAEKIEGLEPSFRDYLPVPSPDGRYLAYGSELKNDQTGKIDYFLRVVELNGVTAGQKVLEIDGNRIQGTGWTPDSRAIVIKRDTGNRDLIRIDLASKQETKLSDFDANFEPWDFLWSQDGTRILLFGSSSLTSLVRIKDMGLAD